MIEVPGGTFEFVGLITVSPFRISKYLVTRELWAKVNGEEEPIEVMDLPIRRVSWYQVITFCNKYSELEGLENVYTESAGQVIPNWSANGYRLPTQMEWMWAAMGADTEAPGKVNKNGVIKRFAGDNGKNSVEDYCVFGKNSPAPIRSRFPNELGIYDMSGNVGEWCWDLYDRLPEGELNDYRGPEKGRGRVVKYGSWKDPYTYLRIGKRRAYGETEKNDTIGFRIARGENSSNK